MLNRPPGDPPSDRHPAPHLGLVDLGGGEEQIIGILKEYEAGLSPSELHLLLQAFRRPEIVEHHQGGDYASCRQDQADLDETEAGDQGNSRANLETQPWPRSARS